MARNAIAKKDYDVESGVVTFSFNDEAKTVRAIRLDELNDETKRQATLHGLIQKGGDSYAGASSIADAIESLDATLDNLRNGVWAEKREPGEVSETLAVETISRLWTNGDMDKARERWRALDAEKKAAVRRMPKFIETSAAIKSERAAKDQKLSDTDAAALFA